MKRYVSGLSQASASPVEGLPDGLFLVRIERAQYRWHAQKPYFAFVFSVLNRRRSPATASAAASTAPRKRCGN